MSSLEVGNMMMKDVIFLGTEKECIELKNAINLITTKLQEQDNFNRTICYCDEYGNFLSWLKEPNVK